jgi:hypothetical protein
MKDCGRFIPDFSKNDAPYHMLGGICNSNIVRPFCDKIFAFGREHN